MRNIHLLLFLAIIFASCSKNHTEHQLLGDSPEIGDNGHKPYLFQSNPSPDSDAIKERIQNFRQRLHAAQVGEIEFRESDLTASEAEWNIEATLNATYGSTFKNFVMRYILTSLFVFSISFAALSQTSFEYLDPDNERNVAIQAFETKHNEYIISFVTIDNNISNCQNGILLLSEGGNKLSHSFFCNDTLELNAYDFFEMEDDLAIVGTGFNPVTEKSYLWFRKVDEEDSTITETFHYLSNREILLFDSFLKEGVFYCAGTTFDFEPFVATLETNGQLLFSKTDFEFIDVVNKLLIDENEYIMRGNRLRRLDAAFNLLEVMPNSPFGFHQQGDMIELSDSTYLITGKKTFAYSAENWRQFGIGILSDEFEELDSLLFGPGGTRLIIQALTGAFLRHSMVISFLRGHQICK